MKAWAYRDFTASIQKDVEFGVAKRGYSELQAIGFAHGELELREEEFPEETPMALVAVATQCILKRVLSAYLQEALFAAALREAIKDENVASVVRILPKDQVGEFKEDVEAVKAALNRL
jgi:hypothetical protein